ncbi:hypothetical protein, partial [Streptococcus pneumoniae]|uniref:hypothetical protein n=1 Tax=Streptococcus pneumoniae TaxID=1313 RepID=UPI001C5A7C6D
DFYRSEHQKRKDEICPFSSLAFLQPTTVDKEPEFFRQRFSVLAANLGQDKEKSPIKGFLGCLHPP